MNWEEIFTELNSGVLKAQNGAKLGDVEVSSEPNVIPEGDLHKNKHDLDLQHITKKGIPVITVDDDSATSFEDIKEQEDSIQQHAEIEKEEIVFSKELTDYIEENRQVWNENNDPEILLEVGKRVTKEILQNTNDNTGLTERLDTQSLKQGGNIHIKESNKGSFTDYCGGKVTDECIQKGKKSPSAAVRKKAVFAENARTWKHASGGYLDEYASSTKWSPQASEENSYIPYRNDPSDSDNEESVAKVPTIVQDTGWNNIQFVNPVQQTTTTSSEPSQESISSNDKFTDRGEFVRKLFKTYRDAGVNPALAQFLVGQDAGESRWGEAPGGSFNYGNITGKTNTTAQIDNQNGRTYHFRNYNSVDDYVQDKLNLLEDNYGISKSDSPSDANEKLNGGGPKGRRYAEASHYKESLMRWNNSVTKYLNV